MLLTFRDSTKLWNAKCFIVASTKCLQLVRYGWKNNTIRKEMMRMESNKNILSKKSRLKRAQIMSVESLLSVNLSIPDYQRPYKWSIKNITDLLVDMENAINEGEKYSSFRYRVGTIILHYNEKTSSFDIVEGTLYVPPFTFSTKASIVSASKTAFPINNS